MHRALKLALKLALCSAVLLGWLGLAAGLAGRASPLLDLANLAVVPLALLAGAGAIGLMVMARGPIRRAILGGCALAAGVVALPPADAPSRCAPHGARARIAWFNTEGPRDPGAIMAWLAQEQPDVVGFGELGIGSQAVRDAIESQFPHAQSCLANQRCGTILYARQRPLDSTPLGSGDPNNRTGLSAASMTIGLGQGRPIDIVAVHLSRPLPLGRQRAELAELEGHLARPADTLIIGDFNATRRMHTLAGFAARAGFAMAAADRPTWPMRLGEPGQTRRAHPVIQIDQVLAGRNWAVERLRTSGDLGSDHRALVADICQRG